MSILTSQQKQVLDLVKQSDYIKSNFYFTGGTALSEFYLHHRYSDDLDFFSNEKVNKEAIHQEIVLICEKLGCTYESQEVGNVNFYILKFNPEEKLKLDFAYYPAKKVSENQLIDGLNVDSLDDIATNKLITVSQRTEIKDFVDLYFLVTEKKYLIFDLIGYAENKFRRETDMIVLGGDFMKVKFFTFLPRMIKELSLETLQSFYVDLAKKVSGGFVY